MVLVSINSTIKEHLAGMEKLKKLELWWIANILTN